MLVYSIAIDGPAASGKSTLGIKLSEHFDYLFFDTGVMYRAVTRAALERGIPISDESAVTVLAEKVKIDIVPPTKEDGRPNDVLIDEVDNTWEIRQPDVNANVSVVSAYPGVRRALTVQQRRIGLRGKVVLVGRDTGTIVLPEAFVKIYLDASAKERARRRYQENIARGDGADFDEILESILARDRIDSGRDVAPLRPADDALIINSDDRSADEVFQEVRLVVEERLAAFS
jgi:cytidylate kinase